MAAAEEAVVGRQGRGVHGLEHEVLRVRDQLPLAARVAAPEQEDDRLRPVVELADDCVGELRPAQILVAVGLPAPDGQGGVEQQNALLRPRGQTAARGRFQSHVGLQLPEDVFQAGRRLDARPHREAQSVRLSRPVVGVLPEQDGLDVRIRGVAQGVENVLLGRINLIFGVFLL